jgi:hypothetical protein
MSEQKLVKVSIRANPKGLNTSRRAVNEKALWKHVKHELRFLGDVEVGKPGDPCMMYVHPRWWLRALGLGGWAQRRACARAWLILRLYWPGAKLAATGERT